MRRVRQVMLAAAMAVCLAAGVGCAGTSSVPLTSNGGLVATATIPAGVATTGPAQQGQSGSASSTPAEAPQATSRPAATPVRIGVNGDVSDTKLHALVAQKVEEAGGIPVRMRAGDLDVGSVDGIILVGGADIRPSTYGEAAHPKTSVISAQRESYDLALAKAAMEQGVPVLGICLGAQELWVARGGTLVQDIPSEVGTRVNHRARDDGQKVALVGGGTLAGIYGTQQLSVYSNHHQAVDDVVVPDGFRVAAKASDGVVEGFESTSPTHFAIGVNWHPERAGGTALFEALVEAARESR